LAKDLAIAEALGSLDVSKVSYCKQSHYTHRSRSHC